MNKTRFAHYRLAVACLALPQLPVSAGEARDACIYVSGKLSAFSGGLSRETKEVFTYDGKLHNGCAVTVIGDKTKLPDGVSPAHALYPGADSGAANAGWKADREADGPDGTSYRIFRDDVFCAIESWWDGGDDSDSGHQPSPLFVITGKCAGR